MNAVILTIKDGKPSLYAAGDYAELYRQAMELSESGVPSGADSFELWRKDADTYTEDGSRKGQQARLRARQEERNAAAAKEQALAKEAEIKALEKQLQTLKGDPQPVTKKATKKTSRKN